MINRVKIYREVILIGGGHTHAIFLRKWGMKPIPGVQISLISPSPEATYTGMLPGFIAGHYSKEEIAIDLVKLCRFAGARFIMGSVDNVTSKQNLISINGRTPLTYDVASVDIGVTSSLMGQKPSNWHTHSIRPLGQFMARWSKFKKEINLKKITPKIVIIGGGVGAIEIALAMSFSIRKLGISDYKITIVDKSQVLKNVHPSTRRIIISKLKSCTIEALSNIRVLECTKKSVLIESGDELESNFTVVAVGATTYEWLGQTDLSLKDGFVEVDKNLQAVDSSNVFAVGDCAHLSFSPRPKAGVFAVRQAPILFKNIRAKLLNRPLKAYLPQKNYLKLISLGNKEAVSDYILPSVSGRTIWTLKNKIDQAFMLRFSNFPIMPTNPNAHKIPMEILDDSNFDQIMCGGCGAKVGSKLLDQVLKNITDNDLSCKNILTGIGDDAAIIKFEQNKQILTTDHLREFNSDLWAYGHVTAIHSLGDIWAMGGEPNFVMAHVVVPEGSEEVQKNWLNQIMGAASNVFAKEGASLVGGHTSIGAEFSIGFSITGTISKNPIVISEAKPGDCLVLTKPIGSGTILAGEMRLISKGLWVESALKWMKKSQRGAAKVLSKARAMTDVTGFGLAGHLFRICQSSNVCARIKISEIPFMNGAEELARLGVRSSLYEDNVKVKSKMSFSPSAKADLLFDPQTSGGLLAAIPNNEAAYVVSELKKLGFCSNLIGSVEEGKPFIYVN